MKRLLANSIERFPACFLTLILLSGMSLAALSQKTVVVSPPDSEGYITIKAGEQYKAGPLKRLFLGRHYRKEWITPVRMPVLNLDTLGGLTPTEQGGGRQTKTLRLEDARGKEYVLRTIDKDYTGALPEITHGTFIQTLAKDQVSTAHPYAALTIPALAEAAGIYHTKPKIVFVPSDARLGKFNDTFGGTLCLFEERPDDDQSDAPHFGNSKEVVSTAKMLEKIFEEADHRVDQRAFLRARLFDIFLGDWGRHEDQWRWAKFKEEGQTLYRPIPRDRDQTYTLFDGLIPKVGTSPEELEHLKSFKAKIKNIKKYTFPARYLDRRLLNELPREVWITEAERLQARLTDDIIERSIRQMPPEVFPISGPTIIRNLKQRRADLVAYATKYYRFLSGQVEVTGSKESELFHIKRLNEGETAIAIYELDKEGVPKAEPYFSRTFNRDITHEVRLFGLDGNDSFRLEGEVEKSLRVRIIGGPSKDTYTDSSSVAGGGRKTVIYDNPGNTIVPSAETKLKLSTDTAINRFVYNSFTYNSGHVIKSPSFSNTRGLHFRAGYTYRKQHWRKQPFSWDQTLRFNYSVTNRSFGGDYDAVFNQVVGPWSLLLSGRYDQALKHYFYGVGNEAARVQDHPFYELGTSEGLGSIGLQRFFGKRHSFTINTFYEGTKVIRNPEFYGSSFFEIKDPTVFTRKHFGGAGLSYSYTNENDEVLPTKGVNLALGASHTQNLQQTARSFQRYNATLGIHVPLGKSLSLSVRGMGVTIKGEPEFYQLNWIGGGQTLRGYRRERFRGKTTLANQNELRWMFNTRNYLFNGKIGLLAFVDEGRVWEPGETSNRWHVGYGGGFFLVPFNRFTMGINYGISSEGRLLHFRFGKLL